MHPLRFPNSGIRAMVFMRKIGFKLRVTRLILNEEEGQQGLARPPSRGQPTAAKAPFKGAVDCGHTPCKGRLLAGAAATRGHSRLQPRPPCKGAAGCGQAPCKGRPPTGTTGCCQPTRGCRPRAGRNGRSPGLARKGLPPAASPVAYVRVVAATAQMSTKRGLGHPFEKRMILPPLNFKNSKDCPHVQNFKNTLNDSGSSEDCPHV
ncbi:hypothetical protein GW17_00056435 [Ensete ventricosum]|nr:hypothetical protein GW17_00056435 [Ensete ventricosum]